MDRADHNPTDGTHDAGGEPTGSDRGSAGDSLFETPYGVRVIPPEALIDDPERTAAFDAGDLEESEQLLAGFDPEALIRNTRLGGPRTDDHDRGTRESGPSGGRIGIRRRRRVMLRRAVGPGARFVYALILITVTLGMMGLALSWQNAAALMVAGVFAIASTILLWAFWRSWLDGLPYAYRLLTSLGEDAENLLQWRVRRAVAAGLSAMVGRSTRRRAVSRVRALYR